MTPYYQTQLGSGKLTSESDSADSGKDTEAANGKMLPNKRGWFNKTEANKIVKEQPEVVPI